MDPIIRLFMIVIGSYLLGSFPSAVIISKTFFGFDIRKKGSGNMGSTNAMRILGWKWGLLVQILDILKGVLAVSLVNVLFDGQMAFTNRTPFEDITVMKMIAGVFAVIGHIWSIFVGFKGGKGINTGGGFLLAIAPTEVAIAFGLFLLVVMLSGYISLGSMIAAITIPLTMFLRHNVFSVDIPGYHIIIYFTIATSLIVIYAHRSNIARILHGNESKFSKFQLLKFGKK
ncbi:MAG: glycerol-3-phosphate 1-O-acyltransferase PlsY [Ignavibacteria bacterium]|jgi:glycerol-3-phosphate acyltransferase PlsY